MTNVRAIRGVFGARALQVAADLSVLREAREWAALAAADFGLDEENLFQVRLATSEAVTNAILHGSGSPDDTICLRAREEAGAIVFEVRDRGADAKVARTAERLAEGGRGLELVALVMDDVEFLRLESGSLLRYAKRREAA